jgi:CsoR family transcriptional regulator, copper-sensing transcriptional repressor
VNLTQVAVVDRKGFPEAFGVSRPELAVADAGRDREDLVVDRAVTETVRERFGGDHDPERFASTGRAMQLDERDVVAAGEDPDRGGRDDDATRGAVDTAGERVVIVARIHRPEVYPFGLRPVPAEPALRDTPALRTDTPVEYHPDTSFAIDRSPVPTSTTRRAAASPPANFRHSYSKDKTGLIRRLSRMEGQVRGIARMIEREEYCVDILQQTSALRAAVDALSILVLEDHVQGCVRTAAEHGEADAYVDEVIDVVRRTLGRPVRSTSRTS